MKIDKIFIKRSNSSTECTEGLESVNATHGTVYYGITQKNGRPTTTVVYFFPQNAENDSWAQSNQKAAIREARNVIKNKN